MNVTSHMLMYGHKKTRVPTIGRDGRQVVGAYGIPLDEVKTSTPLESDAWMQIFKDREADMEATGTKDMMARFRAEQDRFNKGATGLRAVRPVSTGCLATIVLPQRARTQAKRSFREWMPLHVALVRVVHCGSASSIVRTLISSHANNIGPKKTGQEGEVSNDHLRRFDFPQGPSLVHQMSLTLPRKTLQRRYYEFGDDNVYVKQLRQLLNATEDEAEAADASAFAAPCASAPTTPDAATLTADSPKDTLVWLSQDTTHAQPLPKHAAAEDTYEFDDDAEWEAAATQLADTMEAEQQPTAEYEPTAPKSDDDAFLAEMEAILKQPTEDWRSMSGAEAAAADASSPKFMEPAVHSPATPIVQNRSGKKRRADRLAMMQARRRRVGERRTPRKVARSLIPAPVCPAYDLLQPQVQPSGDPWQLYGPRWESNLCVFDSVLMALFAATLGQDLDAVVPAYMGSSGLAMVYPAIRALATLNNGSAVASRSLQRLRRETIKCYMPLFTAGAIKDGERTYTLGDELSFDSVLSCLYAGLQQPRDMDAERLNALMRVRVPDAVTLCSRHPRDHRSRGRPRRMYDSAIRVQRFGAHSWLGPAKHLLFLQTDGKTRPSQFAANGSDGLGPLPADCICSVIDLGDYLTGIATAGLLRVCADCHGPMQEVYRFGSQPGPALLWFSFEVTSTVHYTRTWSDLGGPVLPLPLKSSLRHPGGGLYTLTTICYLRPASEAGVGHAWCQLYVEGRGWYLYDNLLHDGRAHFLCPPGDGPVFDSGSLHFSRIHHVLYTREIPRNPAVPEPSWLVPQMTHFAAADLTRRFATVLEYYKQKRAGAVQLE